MADPHIIIRQQGDSFAVDVKNVPAPTRPHVELFAGASTTAFTLECLAKGQKVLIVPRWTGAGYSREFAHYADACAYADGLSGGGSWPIRDDTGRADDAD